MTVDNPVNARAGLATPRPARLAPAASPVRCEVLVGVDGSGADVIACELAAREASMRGWPLRVVRVAGALDTTDNSRDQVAAAVLSARATVPSLRIRADEAGGHAVQQLIELSGQAGLLVLGHSDRESIAEAFTGCAAGRVAAYAQCPVLLARESRNRDLATGGLWLVVDVDGSPGADAAFEFAVVEARLRGVGMVAVHAAPQPYAGRDPLYAGVLADVGDSCMGIQVQRRRIPKDRRNALRDLSVHASALVVGITRVDGAQARPPGRVLRTLMHDAFSPIFVVHGAADVSWPTSNSLAG
jgi:nucleotide-binding universal stress UspA family protein